jgi:predicted RNA-binding protein
MCLAKAYARPVGAAVKSTGDGGETNGAILLMENVSYAEIDGDHVRLRSLFGATKSLLGHIASIDFSEGKLILQCVEAPCATGEPEAERVLQK